MKKKMEIYTPREKLINVEKTKVILFRTEGKSYRAKMGEGKTERSKK